MGRSIKKKFDVNNVFFKNQHDQKTRTEFLQSQLFPVFIAAYNNTNGEIRVGNIVKTKNPNSNSSTYRVALVNQQGFTISKLHASFGDDDKYKSFSYERGQSPLSSIESHGIRALTTGNPRYLQSKLLPTSSHDVANSLRSDLIDSKHCVASFIRRLIDSYIDSYYGRSLSEKPTIAISDKIATYISNVVMGKMSFNDLPLHYRNVFDTAFKTYSEKLKKFTDAVDAAGNYIAGDKWLFFPKLNGGVSIAAITGDHIKEALSIYNATDSLPLVTQFNYTKYSIEPQWYADYTQIPEEYRTELEYSLTMLKVQRNSSDLIPDHEGYGHKHWADVGCGMFVDDGCMLLLQR